MSPPAADLPYLQQLLVPMLLRVRFIVSFVKPIPPDARHGEKG